MGMGVSLLLIAVGAVLVWAVNATVSGIEIHTIGWILLAVGAIGALFSLIFWSSWGGVGGPSDASPPHGRPRGLLDEHRHPPCRESPASAGLSSFQGMPMRLSGQ